jgi:hypothetical protein
MTENEAMGRRTMRLIDADHLLFLLNSAIELRKKLRRNTSDLDMMVDAVNDEPTAYDQNKVVEQLEEYLFEKYCVEGDAEIARIVKEGGTDGN